jgi:hypothetical protein
LSGLGLIEGFMLTFDKILNHVFISLLGTIFGILIGGAIVFLFGRFLLKAPYQSAKAQRLGLLIPWRTLLVGILEFFLNPLPILGFLASIGLAQAYATVSISGQIACMVVLFTPISLFEKKAIQPSWVFLSSTLRSIATMSVALTTATAGNSGLGFFIFLSLNNHDFGGARFAWLITIFICLAIDLAAGILQFSFGNQMLFEGETS